MGIVEQAIIKVVEVLAPRLVQYAGPTLVGYLGATLADSAPDVFLGMPNWAVEIARWGGWVATLSSGCVLFFIVASDVIRGRR